jgi:hypothetical protein
MTDSIPDWKFKTGAEFGSSDCERRYEKLTEWELKFVADISERESLTEKQIVKLEKIWERVT